MSMTIDSQVIIQDWSDLKYLCTLMDTYKSTEAPFFGKNENGEDIVIEIYEDFIFLKTYQSNGWIRSNYYHRDGTREELFIGRWNRDEETLLR